MVYKRFLSDRQRESSPPYEVAHLSPVDSDDNNKKRATDTRAREKVSLRYGEDVKEEANLVRERVLVLVSRLTNRGALATIDTEVLYFLLFFLSMPVSWLVRGIVVIKTGLGPRRRRLWGVGLG